MHIENSVTVRNETWNVESRFRSPSGKRVRTLPVPRNADGTFTGGHNHRHIGTFGQVAKNRRRRG